MTMLCYAHTCSVARWFRGITILLTQSHEGHNSFISQDCDLGQHGLDGLWVMHVYNGPGHLLLLPVLYVATNIPPPTHTSLACDRLGECAWGKKWEITCLIQACPLIMSFEKLVSRDINNSFYV